MKLNLDEYLLKQLSFKKKQQIRCNLRALPNEIKGGISTSIFFLHGMQLYMLIKLTRLKY